MNRLTNSATKEAKSDVTVRQVTDKLAEYEDFEEIFRSKMTDDICNFLRDKEEFGKWLDRNRWTVKKCDEYARAEEQGKLLKLPCTVGDTVYTIYRASPDTHFLYDFKIDALHLALAAICGTFGKTLFLTREEAEASLKEL